MLDPQSQLSPELEKQRYLLHNNDAADPGYQKFVQPIVDAVKMNFNSKHQGLDFGSGSESVVAKLLGDSGYSLSLYDPFFHNEQKLLKKTYDYIVCCEVMEHFVDPKNEFTLLRSLLQENGKLFCMTSIYNEEIDFKNWYYKNDLTHRFFYHKNSLAWIKSAHNFSALKIKDNLIEFAV